MAITDDVRDMMENAWVYLYSADQFSNFMMPTRSLFKEGLPTKFLAAAAKIQQLAFGARPLPWLGNETMRKHVRGHRLAYPGRTFATSPGLFEGVPIPVKCTPRTSRRSS
jgi:hypothetical protein